MAQSPKHVVVAGAGIIGASIAWHLAKAGCAVTLIDATAVAAQASGRSFGWINPWHGKRPRHYHRLSRLGVRAWREAAKQLPLPVRWGGCLAWTNERDRHFRTHIDALRTWGANVHTLSAADLSRQIPHVNLARGVFGVLSEDDGWVDAAAATRTLVEAAQAQGARVQIPCRLTASVHKNNKLTHVATSLGEIPATNLVLACGIDQTRAATRMPAGMPRRKLSQAGM